MECGTRTGGQTEEQPYLPCSFLTTPRPALPARGAQPAGTRTGGCVLPSEGGGAVGGWPVCRTPTPTHTWPGSGSHSSAHCRAARDPAEVLSLLRCLLPFRGEGSPLCQAQLSLSTYGLAHGAVF